MLHDEEHIEELEDETSGIEIEEDILAEEIPIVEPFDLTRYSLVATVAKNGLIIKYDFMKSEEAEIKAKEIFERL